MKKNILTFLLSAFLVCILLGGTGISAEFPWPNDVENYINEVKKQVTVIDMKTFKEIVDKKKFDLIVDIRESNEIADGLVAGAINIPRGMLEFLIWSKIGYPQNTDMNKKIYLYCRSGRRAILAAKSLNDLKLKNVIAIDMDFEEWKKAGNKIVYP
jgi:rhodanese-related sulfurtransferase